MGWGDGYVGRWGGVMIRGDGVGKRGTCGDIRSTL